MTRQPRRTDSGFTLIELLIVIVILGILATVTVIAVNGITDGATTNACKAEQATLQTAVETSFAVSEPPAYPSAATNADLLVILRSAASGSLRSDPEFNFTYTVATGTIASDCANPLPYDGLTATI